MAIRSMNGAYDTWLNRDTNHQAQCQRDTGLFLWTGGAGAGS